MRFGTAPTNTPRSSLRPECEHAVRAATSGEERPAAMTGSSNASTESSSARPRSAEPVAALVDLNMAFPSSDAKEEAFFALRDVSLEIRRGELLVLVGRSGCGKTTVLNLLAGLIDQTSGGVMVMGTTPIAARSHVAYMFARDALLPWRTATKNIEFALELRRPEMRRRERRERAHDLLEMLDVGRARNLYTWQLSQGMRQRVALARTWAIDPDVLLMDEPFAALDAQTRTDVQQTFLEIWSSNRKTVVFVTHDLGEAIVLGDRVIVLAEGRIVDEVAIDIPRPRNALTLVEEPAYRRLHRRLVAAVTGSTHDTDGDTENKEDVP